MADADFPRLTLITGGAASGKSRFAEGLVAASGRNKVYVATAQAWDDEMRAKIAAHQAQRGPDWRLIEAPTDLVSALKAAAPKDILLIDCLTMWLSNLMMADADPETETAALREALGISAARIVCVTNEVGQGIVPENALARRFRNAQGRLNQAVAADADLVVAVMSGLPLVLKGTLPGG